MITQPELKDLADFFNSMMPVLAMIAGLVLGLGLLNLIFNASKDAIDGDASRAPAVPASSHYWYKAYLWDELQEEELEDDESEPDGCLYCNVPFDGNERLCKHCGAPR